MTYLQETNILRLLLAYIIFDQTLIDGHANYTYAPRLCVKMIDLCRRLVFWKKIVLWKIKVKAIGILSIVQILNLISVFHV